MSIAASRLVTVVVIVLGLQAASAFAQPTRAASCPTPTVAERLHANALASFRQARFPEAYGRFIALADAGHAPAAELALWMYQHGPAVFGREWDTTPEQLAAWSKLAGQPVQAMVARSLPAAVTPVASRSC